jgi:hypothetical protein
MAALARAARLAVLEAAPGAVERVRPGWQVLGFDAARYFAHVAAHPDHVRIGFEQGVLLPDPRGLLRGRGSQVRWVELRRPADLRRAGIAALIRAAAELAGVGRGRESPAERAGIGRGRE